MANAGQSGSSKRSGHEKLNGVRTFDGGEAAYGIVGPSSYRLFPQPGQTHLNMIDMFSMDQSHPQPTLPMKQYNPRTEVLTMGLPKAPTTSQAHFPIHAMKIPTCLDLPEGQDINANNDDAGLNVQLKMHTHENNLHVSTCGSSLWFPSAPATVQQSSYIPSHAPGPVEGNQEDFHDIMAVQHAYICALTDPDQITPLKLLHQSPNALKHHYARDIILMLHSGESSINVVTQEPRRASSSVGVPQRTMSPVDSPATIICMKGRIVDFCVDSNGSRLIQHALETATPEEIIIVYNEVIPHARALSIDVFANHAVQKLLEYGPKHYKREFIGHLIGHVLPLSRHMYGSHVMQKAFQVGDLDLQIQMAKEFAGEVPKCALEPYANHVIQKCVQCVPSQHIKFIFRSLCRKVTMSCTNTYGCHVIKTVLAFCNDPEIIHAVVSEIIEAVVKLAKDQYGNYVVQHVVEHGGPVVRSIIVNKFRGLVVNMSYHKSASNVIEKCITFGSFQDRQLITTEILTAGNAQLLDMMCHLYANFVIKELATVAEEVPLLVLADVARCNMARLTSVQYGRHVIAHIEGVLAARGWGMTSATVSGPQLPGPRFY